MLKYLIFYIKIIFIIKFINFILFLKRIFNKNVGSAPSNIDHLCFEFTDNFKVLNVTFKFNYPYLISNKDHKLIVSLVRRLIYIHADNHNASVWKISHYFISNNFNDWYLKSETILLCNITSDGYFYCKTLDLNIIPDNNIELDENNNLLIQIRNITNNY